MFLRMFFPEGTTESKLRRIFDYCEEFGKAEILVGEGVADIKYKYPEDLEEAYKTLSKWLVKWGPGFSVHQVSSFTEVQQSFVSQVFEMFKEIESDYGLVIEPDDLMKLIFHEDGKTLWEDVSLPEKARKVLTETPTRETLEDWIWDIKIDRCPIKGVCCTGKWLITLGDKYRGMHGLMDLEGLRVGLISDGRLKDDQKARMLIKTCGCS